MKCGVISQVPVYAPVTANQKDADKSSQGSFMGRETTALNTAQPECKLLGGGVDQEEMSAAAICEVAIDLLDLTQIQQLIKRGQARDFLLTKLLGMSREYKLIFSRPLILTLKEELNKTNPSAMRVKCCLAAMISSAKASDAQRLNGAMSLAFDLMRHVCKQDLFDNLDGIGTSLTHYQECQEALLMCERYLTHSLRDSGIQYPNSSQYVNPYICRAIRAFSNAYTFFNSRVMDMDELTSQYPKPPQMGQLDPSIDQNLCRILSQKPL